MKRLARGFPRGRHASRECLPKMEFEKMGKSERALVVTEGFGKYDRGSIIRDAMVIEAILKGANRGRVVIIEHPSDATGGEV